MKGCRSALIACRDSDILRKRSVTAPMLPQRFSIDARREIGVIREAIKELMPGFVGDTSGEDHGNRAIGTATKIGEADL